jgi:pyrimidine operon attenuation protein / uracil phosphoribosyltransferase
MGVLVHEIKSRCPNYQRARFVGVHTGGVWVAERLCQALGLEDAPGTLNIAFYRDDFTQIGLHPEVKPSSLPFEVDDQPIVLVDDVLHTGRTIRAALNEIFDYGRPAQVILATLVVRNGRELPIQPDVYGLKLDMDEGQHIKLKHEDGRLSLELLCTSND